MNIKMLHFNFYRIFQGIVILYFIFMASCTFKFTSDSRIIGGEETTIGEVPYLVNLRRNGEFSCGGSLITYKCVLTAAHCVKGVPASSLTINAGVSRLSELGEERQVEQHFVSAFYSPTTLDMDVAVLLLSSGLNGKRGNKNIATIPLCSRSPANDEFVKISGWGITNENNNIPPDQVRTTNVRVVSKSDCMLAYAGKAILTSTMFCATIPGERDSCSGDSGGPVVYNGQVCGIVSWGFGCARKEYPGVYTNVLSRRVNAFIKQTVMRNCM